jgi:polyhydroxyalkanoate synthesis regulator phasin
MGLVLEWANVTYQSFIRGGMGAEEAEAKVAELFNTFGVGVLATNDWADSNYEAVAGMEASQAAAESQAPAIEAVADATNDADAAMRKYTESLLFKIASEGLSQEAAYALAEAMGLIDEKTVAATKQVNVYKGMLDAGIITQEEYNLLVEQLATDLENTPEGKEIEITTNVEDVLDDLDDLQSWKSKPIPITLEVDDSAITGYSPPTRYGTVVYTPSTRQTQAVGGAVYAGNPYIWQEYGYRGEVFVPSADGFVLSRADAERALARALYGGESAIDPEAIGKAVAKALSGITGNKQGGGNVYNLTMPTSSNPADVRTAFELMEAWA